MSWRPISLAGRRRMTATPVTPSRITSVCARKDFSRSVSARNGAARAPAFSITRSPNEVLGQGCPSTALAFNMHASVVMPLLQSAQVSAETKRQIAELVVQQRKLIAGNFSEPVTTSLIGERPLKARARQVDGGYRVPGRKMYAAMLEAADFVLVMAYPDGATNSSAGIILML